MRPEEKFEVLKALLERGAEVRTFYKSRRVVAVEQVSERYVLIKYADGGVDKLYIADFGRRRFVVVL
jgi:hypothetical protein